MSPRLTWPQGHDQRIEVDEDNDGQISFREVSKKKQPKPALYPRLLPAMLISWEEPALMDIKLMTTLYFCRVHVDLQKGQGWYLGDRRTENHRQHVMSPWRELEELRHSLRLKHRKWAMPCAPIHAVFSSLSLSLACSRLQV